jgi:integrase
MRAHGGTMAKLVRYINYFLNVIHCSMGALAGTWANQYVWNGVWNRVPPVSLTNDRIKRLVATSSRPVKESDGHSLNIYVKGGHASWVYVFRDPADGRIRHKGLGRWPDVTPAAARRARDDFSADLRAGRVSLSPPKSPRAMTLEAARAGGLFGDAAKAYLGNELQTWDDRTRGSYTRLVERYAASLYSLPIRSITPEEVENVVRPLWNGSRTSRGYKLLIQLRGIFRSKRIVPNPASDDAQPNLITDPKARPEHFASMPANEVPAFLHSRNMAKSKDRAARMLALTGCRRDEVLNASWREFDLKARVWMIPGERTKRKDADQPQAVPLTDAMLETMGAPGESDARVFPGRGGRKLGNDNLGVPAAYHPHGFRTTIASWAQEQDHGRKYPKQVIDRLLSHRIGNTVDAAYLRSDLFAARRELMNNWSEYATRC